MPLYDYACKSCGVLEIEHSIKDQPKTQCPQCGQEGLERQIGRTSFVLQGPGWAKDGYRGKSNVKTG